MQSYRGSPRFPALIVLGGVVGLVVIVVLVALTGCAVIQGGAPPPTVPPRVQALQAPQETATLTPTGVATSTATPAPTQTSTLVPPTATATLRPPTPTGRQIIKISNDDLARISVALRQNGLSTSDINTDKTVTFALPGIAITSTNAIIFMTAPLTHAPKVDTNGYVIGALKAERPLVLSDSQTPRLPPDMYLVKVKQNQMIFVSNTEEFAPPSLKANVRRMQRGVTPPESIITYKDICFSWDTTQICSEPAPRKNLTGAEGETIHGEMTKAVQALAASGQLRQSDINLLGTMPDVEGNLAVERRQASLLAAPTSFRLDQPVNGALLGAVDVLLDIEVPRYPTIPKGVYAVRAVEYGKYQWQMRLVRPDGSSIIVPAQLLEVRGQIEEPMAILLNLWIGPTSWGLCIFECG